ncbi:MAG: hypothetical protein ABJB04_04035 [Betaproteobacteria bacterium]
MLIAGLLLSIAVPLFAGLPWLLAMQRESQPGNWPIAAGYGYAFGLLIIVAGMRLLSFAHLPIGLATATALPLVIGALGWKRSWRMLPARIRGAMAAARLSWRQMNRATRIVCIAAGALIVIRMTTLGIESMTRPIFPWEAVSGVAAKARVWYELGQLAPFVQPVAILQGLGNFTDADPSAFALPSLLLVWTAAAIGQWHEGAVAFPWWMLGVAMGLAFFGHLRRSGAGIAFSLAFTYVLASIPLIDMHIALSGAPQWIAATGVGLAGCAFLRWLEDSSAEHLAGVAIGACLALFTLASTWPWFAIFLFAAAMQRWPRWATKLAIGVPLIVAITLLALMQTPVTLAGLPLRMRLASEWNETPESLILLDNWHLLFGILLLIVAIRWRALFRPENRAGTWIVAMGLGLMVVKGVLSLPPYWFGGLRDFSYAGLQFASLMLLWIALSARISRDHKPAANAPRAP